MKYVKVGCLGLILIPVSMIMFCIFVSGNGTSTLYLPFALGNIPSNAANVEYYIPPPMFPMGFTSFDINEEGYLRWVKEWQSKVSNIGDPIEGTATIYYFNKSTRKNERLIIENALTAKWTEEDSGIYLIYDTIKKRAQFMSHTR